MSTRPVSTFVSVRGTMVSTSASKPSTLHVSALEKLGLPNGVGVITIENVNIHVTYHNDSPTTVSAWASEAGSDESRCSIA